MATKILNIEVGKRIVKVCVSEKKGKAYSISDSFFFATPENAVVDGQIIEVDSLAERLKEELAKHIITTNNVIFSLSSSKIASREVTLPPVKTEQIRSIVNTNASDYFPIDVAKYIISSSVIEQNKEETRVMVAAVPLGMIEKYIELADSTGLTIKSIDFSGNSQYQVLKGIHGEGVDMYITVNADCSCVTFMENGDLLLQRALAFGGDDVVSGYLEENARPASEYLQALDELCVKEDGTVTAKVATDSLERLVSGIARSLDYFRSSKNGERPVSRIILMGSCSHLSGLKEEIGTAIGAEALWLEEVEDLKGFANSIGSISAYINCIGASIAPMDCLPKEYLARKRGNDNSQKIKENIGFVVGAAAVFLSVVLAATSILPYALNKRKLDKIEKEIMQIVDAEGEYTAYVTYQANENALQGFVDKSVTHNAELKAFFEELEKKMPSDIVLLNASCTEEGISMSITVPGFEEAANVVRQFRSFESFDVISVGAMSKSGEGIPEVSFNISCSYPVPVVEETPVAEEETTEETEAE